MSRSLALIALTGAAAVVRAQDTVTVGILLPAWDAQHLLASVSAVEDGVTTFIINCEEGVDPQECGVPYGGTILFGPSTWSVSTFFENESNSLTYTQDYNCQLDLPQDEGTCTLHHSEMYEGTETSTSTVEVFTELSSYVLPVVVTAGADLLEAAPGATTTVPETTETEAAETGSTTVSGPATTETDPSDDDDDSEEGASESTSSGGDNEDAAVSVKVSALALFAAVGGALLVL